MPNRDGGGSVGNLAGPISACAPHDRRAAKIAAMLDLQAQTHLIPLARIHHSDHSCPLTLALLFTNTSCRPISRSSCYPRSSNGPDYFSDPPPAASLAHSLPPPPRASFILINPNFLLSLNHNILSFLFCLSA